MPFQPSKYQAAIFDWIQNGTGNAVVDAKAGSGKTTTIVQALQHIPSTKKTIFLAFNKEIANTLKNRVPSHIEARTLNSLGYSVWLKHLGRRAEVDGNKLMGMAREISRNASHSRYGLSDSASTTISKALSQVVNLARKAKVVGLVPASVKGAKGLVEDTIENWTEMAEHFSIELNDVSGISSAQIIDAARFLLAKSVAIKHIVDFDDQFYMPLVYEMAWPKYDWVFVDESQDVSDIQRAIIKRLLNKTTRLVVVGDPNQSIYGFRGANPNSMAMLREEFNAVTLPLSISYRCAKSIIAVAQGIVPSIEAAEDAPDGLVETLEDLDKASFNPGDMIICRNIAPIIKMAYSLIERRQACLVRGRDIGQGLAALIKKLRVPTSLLELGKKLDIWRKAEVAKRIERDVDANVQDIADKADSLEILMEFAAEQTVPGVLKEIDHLFGLDGREPANAVILSSIHRAKGLEADTVYILNPELMPSRYAKKDWEKQQEANITYVAVTRARTNLFYISFKKEKS